MDFEIPADIQDTLDQLDAFIEAEIKPLEHQDDNIRFFDHRREWSRTDFDNDGVPRADWEELLRETRRRADAAGWLRLALPAEFGGQDASNLKMAIIGGKKLSTNQGIQFPLVELHNEAAMLRQLVRYTASMLDKKHHATCRPSTSTDTTVATASPRAPRRSRCARSASTSSASAASNTQKGRR